VQSSSCTDSKDSVCSSLTVCDPTFDYVQRKNDYRNDYVCKPKTLCTASSQRGMYEKYPAVDSVDFRINGSDAVCANYSQCPDGYFQSFSGGLFACGLCDRMGVQFTGEPC
jgi:hypothetical protein